VRRENGGAFFLAERRRGVISFGHIAQLSP
jgi:hypothetical protein